MKKLLIWSMQICMYSIVITTHAVPKIGLGNLEFPHLYTSSRLRDETRTYQILEQLTTLLNTDHLVLNKHILLDLLADSTTNEDTITILSILIKIVLYLMQRIDMNEVGSTINTDDIAILVQKKFFKDYVERIRDLFNAQSKSTKYKNQPLIKYTYTGELIFSILDALQKASIEENKLEVIDRVFTQAHKNILAINHEEDYKNKLVDLVEYVRRHYIEWYDNEVILTRSTYKALSWLALNNRMLKEGLFKQDMQEEIEFLLTFVCDLGPCPTELSTSLDGDYKKTIAFIINSLIDIVLHVSPSIPKDTAYFFLLALNYIGELHAGFLSIPTPIALAQFMRASQQEQKDFLQEINNRLHLYFTITVQ